MKILIITDIHYPLERQEYEVIQGNTYDVCFLLGDIPLDVLIEIKSMVKIPLYGLRGNHDTESLLYQSGIENLHGRVICSHGVRFTGFEGSHKYKQTDQTFMVSQKESIGVSESIPEADVILSHDAPYYMYELKRSGLKALLHKRPDDKVHCGLKGLSQYVNIALPGYLIHGHYHMDKSSMLGRTKVIGCYRVKILNI